MRCQTLRIGLAAWAWALACAGHAAPATPPVILTPGSAPRQLTCLQARGGLLVYSGAVDVARAVTFPVTIAKHPLAELRVDRSPGELRIVRLIYRAPDGTVVAEASEHEIRTAPGYRLEQPTPSALFLYDPQGALVFDLGWGHRQELGLGVFLQSEDARVLAPPSRGFQRLRACPFKFETPPDIVY